MSLPYERVVHENKVAAPFAVGATPGLLGGSSQKIRASVLRFSRRDRQHEYPGVKTIKETADDIPPGAIPRPGSDFTCRSPARSDAGSVVPPDQHHWQQHPWEGASEWVFPARAGQQHSLSPAKTKRKFSLHKSPNFVDFVVV